MSSFLSLFLSLCLITFHFSFHLSDLNNCESYMLFAATTVSILTFIHSYILLLIFSQMSLLTCIMPLGKDHQLFHDLSTSISPLSYAFGSTGLQTSF